MQLAQVDQCCDELAKLMTQAKYQHVELAMSESDPEDKRDELLKLIDEAGVDSLDALDAATNEPEVPPPKSRRPKSRPPPPAPPPSRRPPKSAERHRRARGVRRGAASSRATRRSCLWTWRTRTRPSSSRRRDCCARSATCWSSTTAVPHCHLGRVPKRRRRGPAQMYDARRL